MVVRLGHSNSQLLKVHAFTKAMLKDDFIERRVAEAKEGHNMLKDSQSERKKGERIEMMKLHYWRKRAYILFLNAFIGPFYHTSKIKVQINLKNN